MTLPEFIRTLSVHADWTNAALLYVDGTAVAVVGVGLDDLAILCVKEETSAREVSRSLLRLAALLSEDKYILVRK